MFRWKLSTPIGVWNPAAPPPTAPPLSAAPPPAASASAATPSPAGGGVIQSFQVTMEAQALISKGEIEKAFAVVLGASSLELLVWLCGKLTPAQLLAATPGPSQIILASLVQQLGHSLDKDSAIKVPWLHEALQRLNPHDPIIAPSIGRILNSITENARAAVPVLGQPAHPQHAAFQQVAMLLSTLIQPSAQ